MKHKTIRSVLISVAGVVWLLSGFTSCNDSAGGGADNSAGPPGMAAGATETFTADSLSFDMKFVPGGLTFPTELDDSGTASVDNAFWMSETEVTYALWQTVYSWATTDTGSGTRADGGALYTFANAGRQGGDNGTNPVGTDQHPVTTISWRDAIVWCNALTEWYNANNGSGSDLTCVYYADFYYYTPLRTADTRAIVNSTPGKWDCPYIYAETSFNTDISGCAANGFRLPTCSEWELAARYRGADSTNTVDGYSNPWYTKGNSASGDTQAYNAATPTVGDYAVFNINSGYTTAEVKSRFANALGLYDMSGNVWEWCFDWYGLTGQRMWRGGAWSYGESSTQVGEHQHYALPYDGKNTVGFRLVRTE